MGPEFCPICDRSPDAGVKMQNGGGVFDGLSISCPQCGRYELLGGETIHKASQWGSQLKSALSCAARQAFEVARPLQITSNASAEQFAAVHMHTRVSENQDRLLHYIARKTQRPNRTIPLFASDDFTLIDCYSSEEFLQMKSLLGFETLGSL